MTLEISARIFLSFFFPFPPFLLLFCEGFTIALSEFIGFIMWVTEATVSVKENWFPFQNVMYLIFCQYLGLFQAFLSS
jgi:hypothetical protein